MSKKMEVFLHGSNMGPFLDFTSHNNK